MNRAQEILQSVDEFLEEHKSMTLDQWNEIVLGIQEKSVRESLKELGKMIEPKKIEEIREALQVIQLNAEIGSGNIPDFQVRAKNNCQITIEQVKRIGKLLPKMEPKGEVVEEDNNKTQKEKNKEWLKEAREKIKKYESEE